MVCYKFQPNLSEFADFRSLLMFGYEIAVGEASENTTLGNGHVRKAKIFWTVKFFISTNSRMFKFYDYQI